LAASEASYDEGRARLVTQHQSLANPVPSNLPIFKG
jgi:hypothetical protein